MATGSVCIAVVQDRYLCALEQSGQERAEFGTVVICFCLLSCVPSRQTATRPQATTARVPRLGSTSAQPRVSSSAAALPTRGSGLPGPSDNPGLWLLTGPADLTERNGSLPI